MLSKARMEEIALKLLRDQIKREGIHLGPGFRESVAKRAHALDIPFAEAWEFAKALAYELVDLTFAQGKHDQADSPVRAAPCKDAPRKYPPITGSCFIDKCLRRVAEYIAVSDALTKDHNSDPVDSNPFEPRKERR